MRRYYELEAFRLARILVATIYSTTSGRALHDAHKAIEELRRAALSTVMPLIECSPMSTEDEYRDSLERSLGELGHVASCIERSRQAGHLSDERAHSLLSMKTQVAKALSHSVESLSVSP